VALAAAVTDPVLPPQISTDVWGYANVSASGIVGPRDQDGSWKHDHPDWLVSVTPPSGSTVNGYVVTFPGLSSSGGIVHVTARGTGNTPVTASTCQPLFWGPAGTPAPTADERVTVQCFDQQGAPANSDFTVMFRSKPGVPPTFRTVDLIGSGLEWRMGYAGTA
jgi:hypothetical protein